MNAMKNSYQLLDAGAGRKLERFADLTISRPCAQAFWRPTGPQRLWDEADATFTRENAGGWSFRRKLPEAWTCEVGGILFSIRPTDFGHLGVFPEHAFAWQWLQERAQESKRQLQVLNLFAYSGGATLALAKAGCEVCHLDASKKMVDWARQNAILNQLEQAPIRWIVDDVQKFLRREIRRGRRYDGIILDPPSFGRGSKQELFKIDNDLMELLDLCWQVLSPNPSFLFFSCHTPGYTPLALENVLGQYSKKGRISSGEMFIAAQAPALPIPSGSYVSWQAH
jgi:23S rRNA (cytosine1962-C5)-methyltransferase